MDEEEATCSSRTCDHDIDAPLRCHDVLSGEYQAVFQELGRSFSHNGSKLNVTDVPRQICPVAVMLMTAILPIYAMFIPPASPSDASLSVVLKALNLCFASTVISITAVLNFSFAAWMAILLGVPLSISPTSSRRREPRIVYYIAYASFGLGWLVLCPEGVRKAVWDWETLGVWFGPFLSIVIAPLVLQAGVVCILA